MCKYNMYTNTGKYTMCIYTHALLLSIFVSIFIFVSISIFDIVLTYK